MSLRPFALYLMLVFAALTLPSSAVEAQSPSSITGGGPGTGWVLVDLEKGTGQVNVTLLTGWHSSTRHYAVIVYDANKMPLIHAFLSHEPTEQRHVLLRAGVGDEQVHVEPWLHPTSTHIGVKFGLFGLVPGNYQLLAYTAGGAGSWSYAIEGNLVEVAHRTGDRTFLTHVKEFDAPAMAAVRTEGRDVAVGAALFTRFDVQNTFVGVFYRDPMTAAVMTIEPPGKSMTMCAPPEPQMGGYSASGSCLFPEQRTSFAMGAGTYEWTWSSASSATPGQRPLAYVSGADVDFT